MSNPILDALKESTTLTAITTRQFGAGRTDKSASAKVNRDAGAVADAGRVQVNRLKGADQLHKQLTALQNEAKTIVRLYSQPFGDEQKWQMLPNMYFEKCVGRVMPVIAEHKRLATEELPRVAASLIHSMQRNLGGFNVPLPTEDELINAYDLSIEFRPIPESANFKGLPDSTVRKLQEAHDNKLLAAVEMAERDTLERFVEPLEHFVKRMVAYDELVQKKASDPECKDRTGTFRDSVVTNIQELADLLGEFNKTGNPMITSLGKMLEDFKGIKPDDLREFDGERNLMKTRAQQIADNLRGWLA